MMKYFFASIMLGAMMFGTDGSVQAQARANFSGTWVLDQKKLNTPVPNLKSYTLIVNQNEQQITIACKVDGDLEPSSAPDQSRPGHETHSAAPAPQTVASPAAISINPESDNGVGMSSSRTVMAPGRALALVIRQMTCSLDGKEAVREVGGLTPGQIRRKVQWKKSPRNLEINITRDFDFQGKTLTSTVKEQWELSGDEKVLKIKRTVNLLAGWDEVTLVFTKQ
jgi:hypothetical protein